MRVLGSRSVRYLMAPTSSVQLREQEGHEIHLETLPKVLVCGTNQAKGNGHSKNLKAVSAAHRVATT